MSPLMPAKNVGSETIQIKSQDISVLNTNICIVICAYPFILITPLLGFLYVVIYIQNLSALWI